MAGLRKEGGKTVVDYRPPAQAVAMVANAFAELKRTKKGKGKNGTKTEEAAVDAKPSAEKSHGGTNKHARPSHGRPNVTLVSRLSTASKGATFSRKH
jgi:hypothetical protein